MSPAGYTPWAGIRLHTFGKHSKAGFPAPVLQTRPLKGHSLTPHVYHRRWRRPPKDLVLVSKKTVEVAQRQSTSVNMGLIRPRYKSSSALSIQIRGQELCESRGGRPGLPNKPTVSVDIKKLFNQLDSNVSRSGWSLSTATSVPIRFGSRSFSSKIVVCGYCFVTLTLK